MATILTMLTTVLGWTVVYSISVINASRGEAKDMINKYNTSVNDMTESSIEFWLNFEKMENAEQRLRSWRYSGEKKASNLKRLRGEINNYHSIQLDDTSEFFQFLEFFQSDISASELETFEKKPDELQQYISNKLSNISNLSERLSATSWQAFYSCYPSFKIPKWLESPLNYFK